MKAKKKFTRSKAELEQVFGFLQSSWETFDINPITANEIELSTEELFMNMVRHNTSTTEDISIELEISNNQFILKIIDHEIAPFDITKVTDVNFDEYLAEKKQGGLGIHMVKHLMDDIKFEHNNNISTITLIKNLGN